MGKRVEPTDAESLIMVSEYVVRDGPIVAVLADIQEPITTVFEGALTQFSGRGKQRAAPRCDSLTVIDPDVRRGIGLDAIPVILRAVRLGVALYPVNQVRPQKLLESVD